MTAIAWALSMAKSDGEPKTKNVFLPGTHYMARWKCLMPEGAILEQLIPSQETLSKALFMEGGSMSNFIELCLRGATSADAIDDFIDAWHDGEGRMPLHHYLGMTSLEYALWLKSPEKLQAIISSRKENTPISARYSKA
jgi:hypothetical protein